ncbi:MAG: hypothetical protein ACI37T_05980 [Candidatus Gastranaerophilaceae bacterium]
MKQDNNKICEFTLRCGKKLELDLSKCNGDLLMKCRKLSGGAATVIFMISEAGTFDGEKIPAPEILKWSAFDVIELEEIWAELSEKK